MSALGAGVAGHDGQVGHAADRGRQGHRAGPGQDQPGTDSDGLLAAVKNLSRYHREHEKYYSEASLAEAISLQRTARTLIALAERWTFAEPAAEPALASS